MTEFKKYPDNKPNFNGVNYLVLVDYLNTISYGFRFYNEEFVLENEGETIVAFTETDPNTIAL